MMKQTINELELGWNYKRGSRQLQCVIKRRKEQKNCMRAIYDLHMYLLFACWIIVPGFKRVKSASFTSTHPPSMALATMAAFWPSGLFSAGGVWVGAPYHQFNMMVANQVVKKKKI